MTTERFDRPIFKRLANNDTGAAPGHQGGILIPKDIERYFPRLPPANPSNPTVDRRVRAILIVGKKQIGIVDTRYQHQTWAGTRTPERRLTDNLGPLRNMAVGGDFLLIERGLDDPDFYRLTLIQNSTAEHGDILAKVGNRSWGPVDRSDVPVTETAVIEAEEELEERSAKPFKLFQLSAPIVESRTLRIARSRAFKTIVTDLYEHTCAVCGECLVDKDGKTEAQAAHIVPRSLRGSDDPRNGLSLCRSHHWAFDAGLFGIRADRKVHVGHSALSEPRNAHLGPFHNELIRTPLKTTLAPALEALAWHRMNVFRP